MKLTQDKVKELFEYRDGALFWKVRHLSRNRPSVLNGKQVGYENGNGYLKVRINKTSYYLHQLIFLYHHGYIPENVDHKDGNKVNNCIENLREATVSQNMCNTKIRSDNTSGYKGIHFNIQKQKWQAKLYLKGKQIARIFDTKELAVEFMELFREMTHGSFARHH